MTSLETEKQTSPAAPKPEEKSSFFGDLMDVLEAGFLAMFVFALLFIYLVRLVTVDGGSMNPTLLDQDKLLILRPLYEPKNGQIVVIDDQRSGRFTDEEQKTVEESQGAGMILIKRLIAKAGQEIDINFETGDVCVDGVLLSEPYIAEATRRDEFAFRYPFTVPEGYVFVMGDNRMNSMDSRSPEVALIPEHELLGTVLFRYDRDSDQRATWTERFDYLF